MSDFEHPSPEEVRDKTNLARKITMPMLKEFLADSGFHDDKIICQACGGHEFVVPTGDVLDGVTYPVAVTMPIPTKKGQGIWSFIAVCSKCSNTLFFNVGYMVTRLEKAGKL